MSENDYVEAIKKLLKKQRRALSTRKISIKTEITWPTTQKYLKAMEKGKQLHSYSRGNKIYWALSDKNKEPKPKDWEVVEEEHEITIRKTKPRKNLNKKPGKKEKREH